MNYLKNTFFWSIGLFFSLIVASNTIVSAPPRVTVVVIIDQLPHIQLTRLKPYFAHGFKNLIDNGIHYTNAFFPHGMPATATGHAALSTGTYAKDHGITGNRWVNAQGTHIKCDNDTLENAAIFNPNNAGTYTDGASARNIMVDGVSDQFMLAQPNDKTHGVFAISLKSRAVTMTANKLGKAIWFDEQTGLFTSSKAYFSQLPDWLTSFNKTTGDFFAQKYQWNPIHEKHSLAYRFANPNSYQFVPGKKSLIGTTIEKNMLTHSPTAVKRTFDCAQACFDAHHADTDHMVLWVSISSPDKLGHDYGTESVEALDMLYHVDKYCGEFIQHIHNTVGAENTCAVLTADHGGGSIVELAGQKGFVHAQRVYPTEIAKQVNDAIEKQYGITDIVHAVQIPHFFVNQAALATIDSALHDEVWLTMKKTIKQMPGIKNVWTYDDLQNSCFGEHALETYFKKQMYEGRNSNTLTIQTIPYAVMIKYETGAAHRTPYNFDTHVPIIIYQPNVREKKVINKKVWTLQLAPTLAQILEVPKPSACTLEALPTK